jgi:hypothetical protein
VQIGALTCEDWEPLSSHKSVIGSAITVIMSGGKRNKKNHQWIVNEVNCFLTDKLRRNGENPTNTAHVRCDSPRIRTISIVILLGLLKLEREIVNSWSLRVH